MAGASQENGVEVVLVDQAVEVNVRETQAKTGSPVTLEALLDVLRLQRLAQQRIGTQVDHADNQIITSSPVGIHQAKLFRKQAAFGACVHFFHLRRHIGQYTCHKSSYSLNNLQLLRPKSA